MSRIRVLFLPPVDEDNFNAQSLNTREIVLRLDAKRFEITLFYGKKPDPRLLNCTHIRLLPLPARLKTLWLLKEMLSGYHLIAYVDYSPASYLFLHLPRTVRGRTKTVLHVEGSGNLGGVPKMLQFLYQGVVPNCDVYTAITEWVARNFASLWHRQTHCILPVGVDCQFFSPPLENSNQAPTVLFVGTLMERKGPLRVLEAAARFSGVKFRLIGSGRDGFERELTNRIVELGLNNVTLEGGKSQAEIAQAMRESAVFILPSRCEGLPKVTLEAAASGLPCIVFRDYETPSVVDGITGFQVPTAEEMLDKLGALLADAELRKRMGAASRKHAEQFDWNTIARRWQEAYLEVAASG